MNMVGEVVGCVEECLALLLEGRGRGYWEDTYSLLNAIEQYLELVVLWMMCILPLACSGKYNLQLRIAQRSAILQLFLAQWLPETGMQT